MLCKIFRHHFPSFRKGPMTDSPPRIRITPWEDPCSGSARYPQNPADSSFIRITLTMFHLHADNNFSDCYFLHTKIPSALTVLKFTSAYILESLAFKEAAVSNGGVNAPFGTKICFVTQSVLFEPPSV